MDLVFDRLWANERPLSRSLWEAVVAAQSLVGKGIYVLDSFGSDFALFEEFRLGGIRKGGASGTLDLCPLVPSPGSPAGHPFCPDQHCNLKWNGLRPVGCERPRRASHS